MENKPITNTKLKVVFINNSNPTKQIEEQDVIYLHQFFIAVIKTGLNNKTITNNFLGELAS